MSGAAMSLRASGQVDWHVFANSSDLAAALGKVVSDRLRAAIDERGCAALAVSGGSTPRKFFAALSQQKLEWKRVVILPVDERFLPAKSERSNERLIRETLLINEARTARFVSLLSRGATLDQAASAADARVASLGPAFDVVILGLGADGHTASIFPDAGTLEAALRDTTRRLPIGAVLDAAPHPVPVYWAPSESVTP
jgi:6-phosphogluconolactonase